MPLTLWGRAAVPASKTILYRNPFQTYTLRHVCRARAPDTEALYWGVVPLQEPGGQLTDMGNDQPHCSYD